MTDISININNIRAKLIKIIRSVKNFVNKSVKKRLHGFRSVTIACLRYLKVRFVLLS